MTEQALKKENDMESFWVPVLIGFVFGFSVGNAIWCIARDVRSWKEDK